jgi:hypothetical protein
MIFIHEPQSVVYFHLFVKFLPDDLADIKEWFRFKKIDI